MLCVFHYCSDSDTHDGLFDRYNYDFSLMTFSDIRLSVNDGWEMIRVGVSLHFMGESSRCKQCSTFIVMGKIKAVAELVIIA